MRPALTFIAGVLLIWAVANGRAAKLWEAVTGVSTGVGSGSGTSSGSGGSGGATRPPDPSTGTGGGVGHSGDPSHNG